MSRVLVTGGAGFIGSHVVDSLIEAGHEVVVVDDLSRGRRRNVNPKARFYRIDIRKEELASIFTHERPEYVSHHAAHVDLRRSLEDPLHNASVNILGSINLLECCRRYEVSKIIYASSAAIYGEPEHLPCNEDHRIRPSSPYGASKYTVELYLYLYRENYGLDYTILRYPNVYGPRQDSLGEAGVVAIFSLQMLLGEEVTINGSGGQERDFIYVEDCVKANLLALDNGSGEAYNLGSGIGTSVNQLFEEMRQLTAYPLNPMHGPPKPGDIYQIYLGAKKAERELRWRPAVGLREGLQRTLAYFREQLAIIEKPSQKKSN